ncbi:MAG: caspase family protein [Phyllobacteriaceae bacterium]|nr:caspase family protein [Phyllobacteriaceae bacterium]
MVGVTKYPNLAPKNWLVGPANDAGLMRDFLVGEGQFAAANVAVLADDTPGALSSPTHEAIRAQMKALAEKVGKDDFVYLHFGGHGFQQPALDPAKETDGKDEIFLPADTKMPEGDDKRLPNAYIDDEVKADLDAIRAKGAFVWIVFDACHSSTATRAAFDGEEMERKIDWSDLGVEPPKYPDEGSRAVGAERESSLSSDATSAAPGEGGLVAFYAAQTVETTPEMPLPLGQEGAVRQGLFSFTIAQQLAANPNVTYRQLGEAVLQAYSGLNRTRPTPMFEGDLDRQVFNNAAQERVLQWKVDTADGKATLPAGSLHRLAPGAKLAILAKPGDAIEAALGYVGVGSATNFSSTLVELTAEAATGVKAIKPADIPKDAFARVAETPVDFKLTVARPDAAKYPAEAAALNSALDAIVAGGKTAVNLDIVEAGQSADLRFAVLSEKDIDPEAEGASPMAWFLPPNGEVSLDKGLRPASISFTAPTAEAVADPLSENLVRIYRATNLSRLSTANDFKPEELSVSFTLKRAGGEEVVIEGGQIPFARPDDIIHVNAVNSSGKAVDINVLYIGSDHSIGQMYVERLQNGAKVSEDILQFTADSFGIERMVVVLNEAAAGTNVEDLSFLEQAGARQATRGAGGGDLMAMLQDIGGGGATRGAMKIGAAKTRKGAVMIVPVETTPAKP